MKAAELEAGKWDDWLDVVMVCLIFACLFVIFVVKRRLMKPLFVKVIWLGACIIACLTAIMLTWPHLLEY